MDVVLPASHRFRDGIVRRTDRVKPGSRSSTSLHDDVDRASHPDEDDQQAFEATRAIAQDLRVVVTHVDGDVRPRSAVCSDRLVQRGVEHGDEWRSGVRRLSRSEPESRLVPRRGRRARHVHAEVQPRAIEALLDRRDDRRFARPRSAVQDHDPPGEGRRAHGREPTPQRWSGPVATRGAFLGRL